MTPEQIQQLINHDPRLRELKIEWVDPRTLRASPHNARFHPRAQIDKLIESAGGFKITCPVLVDSQRQIIAGHARVEAWIKDGLQIVPVIVISDMTPEQIRLYILADNRLAEDGGWDKELLRKELSGLLEIGIDLELSGFDSIEIDGLLAFEDEPGPADQDDGLASELLENLGRHAPVSQLGDHWVTGEHHLVIGDARMRPVYDELLGEKRARCVFTDPPFNATAQTISGNGQVKHGAFVMGSGELSRSQFELELLRPAFRNIERYCLPGSIAFVCSDWHSLRPIWDAAEGVFVEPKNLITWAKTNAGLGSFYRSQTEFVIPFQVSRGKIVNNMSLAPGKRHRSTLWTYPGRNSFGKGRMDDLADHPTIKNRRMVADALLDVSRPGDIVLDCFLGSGTTLSAAAVTGRVGYGLELHPKYADVALRRVAIVTGEVPRLADGTPIDEVAKRRGTVWER